MNRRGNMKGMKKTIGIVLVIALIAVGIYTFVAVKSETSSEKVQLRMAHGQAADSEIGETIEYLSDLSAEDSSKNLEVDIYPSGVLGAEPSTVEMVQAGVLDMAKVSANTLGQFDERYSIFSLPYLFRNQEHYYNAMANSEGIQELFESTRDKGYIAIGYYANGARNYYLKEDKAVTDPSVLKGKKIRAMVSSTSMEMIELMGGSPVPMASSETYTSLQQGIVDGAENTELALTVDKHEEIVKSYTYTEHQYSQDIYIISTKVWDSLSKEQQEYLKECLVKLNENFVSKYQQMMDDAIEEASIRVLVDKFQSKNQIRTKIAVEIIVLILSIAVFIVGGIMVTANSAGQISAALKLPMQVYYVCIPISGCLMVLYCLERLKRWFTELKEGK